jgi:hypothetical protein
MIHFAVAFAVLLHVLFWGAGLAVLAMPARWRRFWPMLVFPAGWALQSAVVWAGAWLNLPGTNSYGLASELLPLALLAFAVRRRGVRRLLGELGRWSAVGFIVIGSLFVLVWPLARASNGLTTISLGSCDAADYAAGARVLMEFAHGDRSGFIGQTEVVRVMSADNFFDFWLRLNHFTPSALMALNGSVLHCAPHEIVGILTLVVFAGTIPVVFWMARSLVRLRRGPSLALAGVYALSPIPWYAAAQVATGQLIAAPAIALLTWAGVVVWRQSGGALTWRHGAQFFSVLTIGYSLVLGAYNFIVLVCLAPAALFAFARALSRREFRPLVRWVLMMLAPLAVCGVVFADRVAGLVERLMLFQTYDFGWRIPLFTPEGWLGLVRGPDLTAWAPAALRWILAAVMIALLAWSWVRAIRRRDGRGWVAACLLAPVVAGYTYLEIRGAALNTNASYDAYKLCAVFYPLALVALGWSVTSALPRRFVALALAALLLGNAIPALRFFTALSAPPLMVDGELRQLRRVEAMPDVKSVNMIFAELDMWSRLWANEFLLRKPQYFLTHSYEGRLNTPLRGDWDLEGGRVGTVLPGDARRQLTPRFALVDTRAPGFVRVLVGRGWYPEENAPGSTQHWQWTDRDAYLEIDNPHDQPVTLVAALDGRGFGEQDVSLALGGQRVPPATAHVSGDRTRTVFPPLMVPPGRSTLVMHSVPSALAPTPTDSRRLAVCVFKLDFAPVR